MTLIPWESGRPLLWDFTCSDTVAASNRTLAATGPGIVANASESLKCCKYASLVPIYLHLCTCGCRDYGCLGAESERTTSKDRPEGTGGYR